MWTFKNGFCSPALSWNFHGEYHQTFQSNESHYDVYWLNNKYPMNMMHLTVQWTEISKCGKTPTRRKSVTSAERLMPMFSPFTQVRRSKNNVVCVMLTMSASWAVLTSTCAGTQAINNRQSRKTTNMERILRSSKEISKFGQISAQPHTIVKQICFPNGNVLFSHCFLCPRTECII